MPSRKILSDARRVLAIELAGITALRGRMNGDVVKAVNILKACRGRVVVTGMGKSGNIGQKFVATLNSTGTPAVYLHPGDAMHGDIGMVQRQDVVVAISKSGDTPELQELIPALQRLKVKTIGIVGNMKSALARAATVSLDVSVSKEACPMQLAPTASTTVALVMCDALAVALLEQKKFTADDFATVHPGGQLGRRLLMQVGELMARGRHVPIVRDTATIQHAIVTISGKRLGATCVVNATGKLVGIVTDGDLRRFLERATDFSKIRAKDIMTRAPKTITASARAERALEIMETHHIMQLVVLNPAREPVGMLHLHELVKVGFVTSRTLEFE